MHCSSTSLLVLKELYVVLMQKRGFAEEVPKLSKTQSLCSSCLYFYKVHSLIYQQTNSTVPPEKMAESRGREESTTAKGELDANKNKTSSDNEIIILAVSQGFDPILQNVLCKCVHLDRSVLSHPYRTKYSVNN